MSTKASSLESDKPTSEKEISLPDVASVTAGAIKTSEASRIKVAELRTEQAELRTEKAEERTEQAKARTEQAKTRIEQAEMRTEAAEIRTEQAESRTEEAETRTEQAKTRTEEAEIRTEHANTRNELAIQVSEVRYRRLFEAAQDGILILDVEKGRIDDVNPYLVTLLGFSHDEMVGKTVGELSPFKDIVSNQAMLEQLQQNEYVRYDDLQLETKDGRHIAVEFVSNVYEAGDKKVIQCNIRDITERKKADQWLTLLNTCVSNLNDVILVAEADPIDEPGPKIIFVNEAFKRITGYSAEEALGRSPRFLEGEKTDKHFLGEIHQALADRQPIRRQLINYKKDGTEYWMDIDIVPIFDAKGTCTHFTAIERDITEAKKSEARMRRLVDSNAQGVFFWNTKGEITKANDAFLSLVGYTRDDLETGKFGWIPMTPPEYAHLDRSALEQMAMTGVCAPYEKEFIRKDGSRLPIIIGAATFEDNPNEGVCFILDLIERKKLEQQFLRAQRMESIGTLAGGISHDLNNILAPIMMSIGILKTMATAPEMMTVLETIEVSAKRGSDIVRQVLSFARGIEGERIEVQPKHLLKDLESIIKDTFPKDQRLKFSVPNDIWTILGDPTQIHQILLNLSVNARDAMPNGGDLTISAENCVLNEHYTAMNVSAKPGRYVNITVTDTGMGILPAVIDKIFEPFFTTKEQNKGTGLGLSTVMAIVKSHEGIVNVYSEPGKGTTFKVYLPALESSPDALKKQTQHLSIPRGKGETVLVVDDESSILVITKQTLLAFGYRVLTATDGADALGIYAEHKQEIAVVLTDMMMPVMDGAAMIHALTRMNPSVRIVAASGLNANGGVAKFSGTGVKHFLTKPYTAGTLLKTIRTIIDEG
jgi:PAS domain S-box-containing protein